jgi:hypothetical protein
MAGALGEAALLGPNSQGRTSLIILGCIWAFMVVLHLALRLHDIGLWLCFPLLFVPWLLLGPSNWFDR